MKVYVVKTLVKDDGGDIGVFVRVFNDIKKARQEFKNSYTNLANDYELCEKDLYIGKNVCEYVSDCNGNHFKVEIEEMEVE